VRGGDGGMCMYVKGEIYAEQLFKDIIIMLNEYRWIFGSYVLLFAYLCQTTKDLME
jgi:hypothetical protein